MNQITPKGLYLQCIHTLSQCTPNVLTHSEEDIFCIIFEEFASGVVLLHPDSLKRLLDAGLIDNELAASCEMIREAWLPLEQKEWTIQEIKDSEDWKSLMGMCASLKRRLTERYPEAE